MSEINARLERIFARLINTGATTSSAGHVEAVSRELEQAVTRHHRGSRVFRDLVADMKLPDGYDVDTFVDQASASIAKSAVRNTEHLLSAAVIVVAHATCDDVYTEACSVACELDPGRWQPELNRDRDIKLGYVLDKGTDQIVAEQLASYAKNLGNKSLPSRAETLFRHVPVRMNQMIQKHESDYFTMEKLKEYDGVRHEIAHGSKIPEISRNYSAVAALFLVEAGWVAFRSLAAAYALKIDIRRAISDAHTERKIEMLGE